MDKLKKYNKNNNINRKNKNKPEQTPLKTLIPLLQKHLPKQLIPQKIISNKNNKTKTIKK